MTSHRQRSSARRSDSTGNSSSSSSYSQRGKRDAAVAAPSVTRQSVFELRKSRKSPTASSTTASTTSSSSAAAAAAAAAALAAALDSSSNSSSSGKSNRKGGGRSATKHRRGKDTAAAASPRLGLPPKPGPHSSRSAAASPATSKVAAARRARYKSAPPPTGSASGLASCPPNASSLFDELDHNHDGKVELERLAPVVAFLLDISSVTQVDASATAEELDMADVYPTHNCIDKSQFAAWLCSDGDLDEAVVEGMLEKRFGSGGQVKTSATSSTSLYSAGSKKSKSKETPEELAAHVFDVLDTDEDGMLRLDELRTWVAFTLERDPKSVLDHEVTRLVYAAAQSFSVLHGGSAFAAADIAGGATPPSSADSSVRSEASSGRGAGAGAGAGAVLSSGLPQTFAARAGSPQSRSKHAKGKLSKSKSSRSLSSKFREESRFVHMPIDLFIHALVGPGSSLNQAPLPVVEAVCDDIIAFASSKSTSKS